MSPIKELRYLHALIAMSRIITLVKANIEEIESNANHLKQVIVEDNQIDIFDQSQL